VPLLGDGQPARATIQLRRGGRLAFGVMDARTQFDGVLVKAGRLGPSGPSGSGTDTCATPIG
jgi:hypothetical protein